MANVILPLVYNLLTLGKTTDLRTYDLRFPQPIYNNTQVVENQVNTLYSTYYVLPDETMPYSEFRAPIDFILGIKGGRYGSQTLDNYDILKSRNFDRASILVSAEFRSIDRSLPDNARLLPGWQKSIEDSHTHYIDRLMYGSNCASLITIESNVTGDIQIFRRILKDVMGSSGRIGEDIVDLWRKAVKTMRESPDVRGDVYIFQKVVVRNAETPSDISFNVEKFLKYASEFSKHVYPPPEPGKNAVPLYASFRPLHDLDEQYASLEKNEQSETYMLKLDAMQNDAEYAYSKFNTFPIRLPDEDKEKFQSFTQRVYAAKKALSKLVYSPLSIYKDIDVPAFKNAFETYQKNLGNATENYFTAFQKLREEIGVKCEKTFLKPARGLLRVNNNEVVKKDRVENVEKCQDLCMEDQRCRAVGYAEKERECLIYYRSTSSATIYNSKDLTNDANIYDRKCKPFS